MPYPFRQMSNKEIQKLSERKWEPGLDESDDRKVTFKSSDKISSQGIQPKAADKNLLSYLHK